MQTLTNKHILVGISGSIAAYKAAELVSHLRQQGADVRVVMTRSACEFITPMTLQAVSGRPVHTDLMDADAEAAMGHIELARWADLILVAPASADFIARLTQGRADELLSALCLASQAPLAIAPAMNQGMWNKPATASNINTLTQRGVHILGPGEGHQACGETGAGRMLEPADIITAVGQLFQTGELAGLQIIITAGPTREAIDPVRYISNRSSGKMGYALATAAMEAGAHVTLISGPVHLATPERVRRIDIETADEMYSAVIEHIHHCDVFISAAAVADYRPAMQAASKIKKQQDTLQLQLVRTHDILASVATLTERPFMVGFAAETEQLIEHARAKLLNKRLDMIAANPVGDRQGFDQDDNELDVLWDGGHVHLNKNNKTTLAKQLITLIAKRLHAKSTTQNTG